MTESTRAPQGDDWEAVADSLAVVLGDCLRFHGEALSRTNREALASYLAAKRRSGARDSAA